MPFLKYSTAFLFVYNLLVSLRVQAIPLYHPYLIFTGIFGLYLVSRIFFDILGLVDFGATSQFAFYTFSEDVKLRLLINVAIALWALQLGFMLFFKPDRPVHLKSRRTWERIGLYLFYIGMPFLVYRYVMVGLDVAQLGYSARISGDLVYRNTLLVSVMSRLSLAGFFIFLASVPQTKNFKWHLIIFLAVMSLQLLEGGRYHTFCLYLTIFSYVFYTRNVKHRLWMYVFLVASLLFLGAGIGVLRSNSEGLEAKPLYKFVYEQGFGLQILGHTIEYHDEITYKPKHLFTHAHYYADLILNRIVDKEVPTDKMQRMEKYGNLEFCLTYKVNKKAMLGGWDMAVSYMAEAFMLGKEFMVLVLSALIGLIFFLIGQRHRWQGLSLLFIVMFLPSWIFIPRDSLFDFITDNISNTFFVLLILITVKFIVHFWPNALVSRGDKK